jgi:phosphoglycolate phosphatase-like HAD superfamily hydrolase
VRAYLFDIDGTLISSFPAGVRALDRAIFDLFGIADGVSRIDCSGMTDPAIVRAVLSPRGFDSAENIAAVLDRYLACLPGEIARTQYQVLAGVRESLTFIRSRGGVLCGLATGNLERGAAIKLARGDLNGFFQFGGFGSDAEARVEIVRMAIRRAAAHAGGEPIEAVVIGDTPRDIEAAHAASTFAVGVASGRFDQSTLLGCGANLVIPDLGGPESWTARIHF